MYMVVKEVKGQQGKNSLEKRVDGFGIMKNIPSFKEDEEEHPEFW